MENEKKKYSSQAKHIKDNYTQFKFNLKPYELDYFKQKCKENGTTATTELKKFIREYCNDFEEAEQKQ